MARIPGFSRRAETAPARDENGDGRIDERDRGAVATTPERTDSDGDTTTYRSGQTDRTGDDRPAVTGDEARGVGATAGTDRTDERPTAELRQGRPTHGGPATLEQQRVEPHREGEPVDQHREPVDQHRDDEHAESRGRAEVPRPGAAVEHPKRARTSFLATLGLIIGVVSAMFVLSGTLAGYGIALGVIAVLLSVPGLAATRKRRHVSGASDGLLGLLFGLAAIVAGIVALTGQYEWPSTDTDTVQRFREWLDAQFVDRF